MRNINVSKLIDLRKKENVAVKNLQIAQNLAGAIIPEKQEELRAIREQFTAESKRIREAITEAEGRATARLISAQDVVDALIEVDDYLGISKKAKKGTKVMIDCNAQTFPSAYKWAAKSTIFYAEFTTGWMITDIIRWRTESKKFSVVMSETAKADYLKKAETLGK